MWNDLHITGSVLLSVEIYFMNRWKFENYMSVKKGLKQ